MRTMHDDMHALLIIVADDERHRIRSSNRDAHSLFIHSQSAQLKRMVDHNATPMIIYIWLIFSVLQTI